MDLTIRIPDDTAARLQAQAQARGLTVDRWLLELVEQTTLPATNHEPEPVSGMVEENGLRVLPHGQAFIASTCR